MRVLHIITGLAAGGAERQLLLLVRHLDADCEVAVLTNPGSVATAIRDAGVPVHDLRMSGNRDLAVVPRLARLIRDVRPDIVHTHLFRAGLYGRLAARWVRVAGRAASPVAIVATEHSVGETQIEGRPLNAAVRGLYLGSERLGDMTIAVSPTVRQRLVDLGVAPARVTVIPNGIDAPAFRFDPAARARVRARLGIPADRFVVGGVGRLEPGKRFDVLIDALAAATGTTGVAGTTGTAGTPMTPGNPGMGPLVDGMGEPVPLLLVGAGSAEAALRERAERRGVADRVLFTGETSDVGGLLAAMDLLAAPSAEETFGLSVLEALAAGLPVRYVTCPALDDLPAEAAPDARRLPLDPGAFRTAIAESVAGSVAGSVATAGPASTAVTEAGATTVSTVDRTRRVPPAVDHYDFSRVAEQTSALYERLLGARTGRETPAPSGEEPDE